MDIRQFVTNADDEGFVFTIQVDRSFDTSGGGYWSNTRASVKVESISIYVGLEAQDDDGEYWNDGDLGIDHEDGPGLSWDTEAMGLIYTDEGFIGAVREWLVQQGWDAEAVNDIGYSEQGMQDIGRVSCDAYEFAGYLRRLYQEQRQPA